MTSIQRRQSSKDVPRRRLLSRDEERELAASIAGGDQAARNRMVRANLGLVVTIAREFQGRGLALDELIGEGNLGLIRATEEFDPDFGTRFSTYASYWIKQAVREALINRTATIRLPAHMGNLLTKWRRTALTLIRDEARMPDFEEVASLLGLSQVQKSLVHEALRAGHLKPEGRGGSEAADRLLNDVTDRRSPAEAKLQADDERDSLMRRMEVLDDRERTVVAWRYGLEGEHLTLKEIGTRLGLCREWVRKIQLGAICKLRVDRDDPAAVAESGSQVRRNHRVREYRHGGHRAATATAASRRGLVPVQAELNPRAAGRSEGFSM
jgi:RNA polymerase primary sigma factor